MMMSGKQPKRHHYLPQFYLRQFADGNGMLWIFDRQSKQYRRQPPKDTAVQREYYTFRDNKNEKSYELERLFSMVEGQAKPVIKKIEQGQRISANEKETLAIFVAWQYLRVPEYQRGVEESGRKMAEIMMRMRFSSKKSAETALAEYEQRTGKKAAMTAEEAIDYAYSDKYKVLTSAN